MRLNILLFALFFFLNYTIFGQCVVAPVPNDACYNATIANDSYCCDFAWDGICQSDYDACIAAGGGGGGGTSGCVSDVSICTPGVAGPFAFDQTTPGPPTDFADPVGCSTGLFGNANGFGFILLEITTSGPLNLLVDGDASSGFIDVVVYDIPDGQNPCEAVMSSANEIGCNYATSSIGCTQFGSDFPCASSIPAPNVVAGQTIMIIVHDYSTSSNTFTLDLGPTGAQTGPPDATIDQVLSSCLTDASFQMTAASMGGTWSGPGISSDGIFDPATAGLGTHTINYSIGSSPCIDNDVTTINVVDCSIPCSISYSQPAYCASETDPTPTLVGDAGGTYSSTAGLVINASTGVIDLSASTPGNYSITYTPPAGSSCGSVNPVMVEINPLPTVTLTSNATICSGSNITLNAGGASTYSWSPGATLSGTTGSYVVATPATTTTYTVIGTSTDGCTSSNSVTITVSAMPTVVASADASICPGGSVSISASGAATYTWDNGLGSGSSHTVSPASTTTYTVTGTNAAGCEGSDAVTITVNPLPTILASNDVTICIGESTMISVSGGSTYSWDNGLGAGASHTVSPSSTTTYTVTGTSVQGCESTDAVTVTVAGSLTIAASNDVTICEGSSTTISVSGAATYTWDNGLGAGASHTVSPASTTTYNVTGTSASGCEGTDMVTVTISPNPTVNGGADQTICEGTSTVLSASGAFTYSWTGGVTNGVSFTPSIGMNNYTVTGTTALGCESSDDVTIEVIANPTPTIIGEPQYCAGSTTLLEVDNAYTSYAWSTVSNASQINADETMNPITVTVIDANGCQGTTAEFLTQEVNGITTSQTIEICQGESAMIHGISQSVAGVYSQTYSSVGGCDSVSNVTLVVHSLPNVNAGLDQSHCENVATSVNATGATSYSWTGGLSNGTSFYPPMGATTYTVTGTDMYGCENQDDLTITVNSLPIVDAGVDQTICNGISTTLQGSGANTYSWDNGVTDNTAFSPTSTLTYTVIGTDLNGCENSDDVQVTVIDAPTVNAGEDESLCEGESYYLNATGAISYTWSSGDANQSSVVLPNGANNLTVTGTDSYGCENTDNVTITINALPNVYAGQDVIICDGESTTLLATGASTYTWSDGSANGATITPPVGINTYTVTGTSTAGCINSDDVVVEVAPNPVADAGPDMTVCTGVLVTLSGQGGPTGSSYVWNNGVTDGQQFVAASNTYVLTLTDPNGCTDSDNMQITTIAAPIIEAGLNQGGCEGDMFVVAGSGAGIGGTYTWDNSVSDGTQFSSPVGTTTYTVTGTDQYGCTNTDQLQINVETYPSLSFYADVDGNCAPVNVVLMNTTSDPAINCVWEVSNGFTSNACEAFSFTMNDVGLFDVTLSAASPTYNCLSSVTYTELIHVDPVPLAQFDTPNQSVSTFNPTVHFGNESVGADTYEWNFGDGYTGDGFEPTHTYANDPTHYIVQMVAYNEFGCSDTAYQHVEIEEELVFFIPNSFTPDEDEYNQWFQPVFYSGYDPYDFTMLIYNRWGEVIFESHDASKGWDGTYEATGKLCQSGTYTWTIEFKSAMSDERMKFNGHLNLLR